MPATTPTLLFRFRRKLSAQEEMGNDVGNPPRCHRRSQGGAPWPTSLPNMQTAAVHWHQRVGRAWWSCSSNRYTNRRSHASRPPGMPRSSVASRLSRRVKSRAARLKTSLQMLDKFRLEASSLHEARPIRTSWANRPRRNHRTSPAGCFTGGAQSSVGDRRWLARLRRGLARGTGGSANRPVTYL